MNAIILSLGIGAPEVIVIILIVAVYFFPSIIGRHHQSSTGIVLLNLFLGWTFIGWVGALIWACTSSRQQVIIQNTPAPAAKASNIDKLEKLAQMRKDGILTEEEFLAEKRKALA